jgi:hypothetical protein
MPIRVLLYALFALDLLLVAAHAAGLTLRGEAFVLFNLDGESNIPAWYSSTKFALAGTLVALLAVSVRLKRATPVLLAALFLAFSADEAASVHERIGHFLAERVLPDLSMRRKDAFLWPLLFGLPVLAGLAGVLWRLSKERYFPVRIWQQYMLALAVFFAGAIGLELVTFNPFWTVPRPSLLYDLLAIAEETIEHIGASLLVWASLAGLVERRQDLGEWLDAQKREV